MEILISLINFLIVLLEGTLIATVFNFAIANLLIYLFFIFDTKVSGPGQKTLASSFALSSLIHHLML